MKSLFVFDLDDAKFEKHDRIWRAATATFLLLLDVVVTLSLTQSEHQYAMKLGFIVVRAQGAPVLEHPAIYTQLDNLVQMVGAESVNWGVNGDVLEQGNSQMRYGMAVRAAVASIAVKNKLRIFDLGSTFENVRDYAPYHARGMNLVSGAPAEALFTTKRRLVIAIIPAGSGKTSIAKRGIPGRRVRDVDDYYAKEDKEYGKKLRRRGLDGDESAWTELNAILAKLVREGLAADQTNVLLVHGYSAAAELLPEYDCAVFGGKVSEREVLKVAGERAVTDQQWAELTLKNWSECDVKVYDTHDDLYWALVKSVNGDEARMSEMLVAMAAAEGRVATDSEMFRVAASSLGVKLVPIREARVFLSNDFQIMGPGVNYYVGDHGTSMDVHCVKYQLPYSGWLNNRVLFRCETGISRNNISVTVGREQVALSGLETKGEWSQEKALLTMPWASNRNILTYSYSKGDLPSSIFAISNSSNSRDEILTFIRKMPVGIFVLPYDVGESFGSSNFIYRDGLMIDTLGGYSDHVFSPTEFTDCECYTMIDFIFLSHPTLRKGMNPQHLGLKLWFVVVKGISLVPTYDSSLWNSQTHLMKKATGTLRRIHLTTDDALMDMRRKVMLTTKHEGVTDVRPIIDMRVSGSIRYKGKLIYVAVAGHLVNMLLSQFFIPVDLRRMMGAIKSNLIEYSSNKYSDKDHSERFVQDLWHGYFDWFYAVATYEMLCAEYGIKFRKESADYAKLKLGEMSSQFGWFLTAEGFQSKMYRGALTRDL